MDILKAALALGALGAAFSLILAYASRIFATQTDERLEQILNALPGANCGGCGYAGCQNFAQAVAEGNAGVGGCPVGGAELTEQLCRIMDVPMEKNTRLTVLVKCSGGSRAHNRYDYAGLTDCNAAIKLMGGPKECSYGCIGLGTCVAACPFGALSVVDDVAVVDHERCTGCLSCVAVCPKHIIAPVPYYADVNIACSSLEKGGTIRRICDIGCLGCRICEKVCNHDAIIIEDNLASINFEKCTGCGDCAEKCPRKLIVDAKLDRGPRITVEE